MFEFALLEMPDGDMPILITQAEANNLLVSILAGYNFYLNGKTYVVRAVLEYIEAQVTISQFIAELFYQNGIPDTPWDGSYGNKKKEISMRDSPMTCPVIVGAQMNKHITMLEIDADKNPIGEPKLYRLLFWERKPTTQQASSTSIPKPTSTLNTPSTQPTPLSNPTSIAKQYWDMYKNVPIGEAHDELAQKGYGGLVTHFKISPSDHNKNVIDKIQMYQFTQWINSFPSQQGF